ncbi:radical SAM protein [Aromatoleum toluvorans]|uniref:Radical SAM protein n=1 Tax=Aromatoleum toluvorans TaxID=92002 RepID=A0ABX1Q250_9RHOO|nr:radical SAM protein [Aromatoleum toluvorans]NMG44992.1 radical SAM protein [Aromatoleum toluvorans]
MSDVHPVVVLRIDREARRHTGHPRHLHPALDLKYVQARLESALKVPVPLLDGWLADFSVAAFVAQALALRPRVAVIRAVTWCLEESVQVAAALRAAGIVTIAVGQQVQHVARTGFAGWDEAYDLAIAGEPEEAAPRLVLRVLAGADVAALRDESRQRIASGAIALVAAPDVLPWPQVAREELTAYAFPFPVRGRPVSRWAYVLTAWGCPRPCRHCTAIVRKSVGRDLRVRTVDAVVDEVLALKDAGAQAIAFEDDSLLVHRGRFLQLADTLVRRGVALPWMANARPDELDAERVAAASEAGAVLLKVGVDSGSARLIERLGKTADGAGWIAATESAFERLDRAGIGSVALFMVGMPDETEEDAEDTLALARRIRPDYLQMQIYRPYPDVPLWGELPRQVRTHGADYHYLASASSCSRIPPAAVAALQRRFYRTFYLRPGFVARHLARHWRHYLSSAGLARAPGALAYLLRGA